MVQDGKQQKVWHASTSRSKVGEVIKASGNVSPPMTTVPWEKHTRGHAVNFLDEWLATNRYAIIVPVPHPPMRGKVPEVNWTVAWAKFYDEHLRSQTLTPTPTRTRRL